MRFANFCDSGVSLANNKKILLNIGDYLQFLAIQYVYERMGISEAEVFPIKFHEIANYDGEYLILPINYSLIEESCFANGKITISDKIIPVFLSCTLANLRHSLDPDAVFSTQYNVDYLKRFSPIGCRDEYTMLVLRKHGISAYLNGCLTAILPKRVSDTGQTPGKVYFVDVPASLEDYIPQKLFHNCVFKTQQYYLPKEEYLDTAGVFEFVKNQYKEYSAEAGLVITSRLHVAAPCVAMGIPVILAKDIIDYRYAWLDKLIPIYTPANYKEINWNPKTCEYENFKEIVLDNAANRIKSAYEKYSKMYDISSFYENRKKPRYVIGAKALHGNVETLKKFLRRDWNENASISYAFWGITDCAESLYQHIIEYYPRARLTAIIDSFRDVEFHGLIAQKPAFLRGDDDIYVIVVATGAVADAKMLFKKINKPQNMYCLIAESFLEMRQR